MHTIISLNISVAKAPPTEIAPTKNIISNIIMLININVINIQILLSVIKEVVKIAREIKRKRAKPSPYIFHNLTGLLTL